MTRSLVWTLLPCYLVLMAITSIGLSCESSSKQDNKNKCSHSDSEKNQKQGHSKETGDRQKHKNTDPSAMYAYYYRPTPLLHKQACYYPNEVSYSPRRSSSWYQSNKPSFYPRYYAKRPSYKSYSSYQPKAMPLFERPSVSQYGSPYQFDLYKDHPSQLYNSPYKTYQPKAMPLFERPSVSQYGSPYQFDLYKDHPSQLYNSPYKTYQPYSDDEHYPYQLFASEDLDSPDYVGYYDDYDIKTSFPNDYNQKPFNIYYTADDYNDHNIPVEPYKSSKPYLYPKEMKHPPSSYNATKEVSSSDTRLFGVKLSPN